MKFRKSGSGLMKAIPSLLCVGAVYSVVLHLPGPVQVKLEEDISLNSSYI